MNQTQARNEINHAWIDWALRRAGYEDCTCTPEWAGVITQRHGQPGVSTFHTPPCPVGQWSPHATRPAPFETGPSPAR